MKRKSNGKSGGLFLVLLTLALTVLTVQAFPPAPYYTIYGDVRDSNGVLIPVGGASVVVYQNGKEILRKSLTSVSGQDYNYQIRLRMDMLRGTSASYSSLTMAAGSIYTLAVDVGGELLYPIEMSQPPTIGKPADRKRLNLTLGTDSDGDGLPDEWEIQQLYEAGVANYGDLTLIDKNGDFDKDGISNYNEYLAGTYAADATSTLDLKIKEKFADSVRLEFYAIYGKSYTLESTKDLKTWTTLAFSPSDPAAAAQSMLVSSTTGIFSIYAGASSTSTYYRLKIR